MRRRVAPSLIILSLVLCMATCVLWIRSQVFDDGASVYVQRSHIHFEFFVHSLGSRLVIYGFEQHMLDASDANLAFSRVRRSNEDIDQRLRLWRGTFMPRHEVGPFVISIERNSKDKRIAVAAIFPHAAVVVLTAIAPLRWLLQKHVRRKRKISGRCVKCGYDLRASTRRCPECGTIPSETKGAN